MAHETYRNGLGLVLVGVTALSLSSASALADTEERAAQPNVLLILTDDQGAGDLGCAGNPILDTPNIDALATQSVQFERFYVSPVCTPTRAALMTGRSSVRTQAIDTYRGRAMMNPAEVTIAEMLSNAGYATGMFGKWHLGDSYPMRPMDQGFDHVLMHRGGGLGQPSDAIGNQRRYTNAILLRDGEEVPTQGYCMDVYVDEAIAFMEQSVTDDQPFFAYVATNTPHGPFHDVPEDLYAKYKACDLSQVGVGPKQMDNVARIYAMVENIDANVGRLLSALDRLDVNRDTIVIYLHDNGPAISRYVGAMRGTKSMVHEGGIRTPCFMRWPGRIEPGAVRKPIAAHYDVLPTVAEMTGAPAPTGVALDGRSLWPLIQGDIEAWEERTLHIHAHRGDRRIGRHHFAVIGQQYKLLRATGFGRETPDADTPYELYDLVADPYERKNLAELEPATVESMLAEHDAWFADAAQQDGFGQAPRIVIGADAEPVTVLTRNDWRNIGGGGYGSSGTWKLAVDHAQVFTVTVRFRKPVESPVITLTVGGDEHTVTSSGAVFDVEAGEFALPAGPCDLTVKVTVDGKPAAPSHVVVRAEMSSM